MDKQLALKIGLGVLAIGFGALLLLSSQDRKEKERLLKASEAELILYKDKDGLNKAKIEVMETQKLKDFFALESKNEEVIRLQDLAKSFAKELSKQGSATIIKTETKYDTIKEPANNKIYKSLFGSVIGDSISNRWIKASFGFKLDSLADNTFKIGETQFSMKIENDYELVIGRDKTGFLGLGRGKPFADIKNNNPYTNTTALRTYQVDNIDKRKFSIGPSAGVQFDGAIKPYVGVGINYTILKF